MSMSPRPLIAVTGATGAQGGGLVRALLADPQQAFAVRALTRRPHGAAARALAALGAEVVAADLDDPASLPAALHGAHGLFAVTNFWEHFSPTREVQQATHLAEAARGARLRHVVWSTLEDTRGHAALPTLRDRWKVPHMDAKAEADRAFAAAGVPTTCLLTSFYWDNLLQGGLHPQRGRDGRLAWLLPIDGARLPGIAAADIGACAAGLFRRGASVVGQRVGIAGDRLTGAQMAAVLGDVLGEPVAHVTMPPEDYARLPFPGAPELANMFQFQRDCEASYCEVRSPETSRTLHPGLQTFAHWAAAHAAALRRTVAASGA
jgi:uncharacterized protein YbjT (DUF2867 family)